MRRLALVIFTLVLAACTNDSSSPTQAPGGATDAQQAPAPGDPKGRSPFVYCLDLIREKRFEEALTACKEAEKANPGDPQVLKAIEMAEKETGG